MKYDYKFINTFPSAYRAILCGMKIPSRCNEIPRRIIMGLHVCMINVYRVICMQGFQQLPKSLFFNLWSFFH